MRFNPGRFARAPWVLMVVATGGLALLDGLLIEPGRLKVRRVDVPTCPAAEPLVGVRLAQISDLHVGSRLWRPGTIARAVEVCNSEDLDLIAITGDLVGRPGNAEVALRMLQPLRRDLPRFVVPGNHDHVYGRRVLESLHDGLRSMGMVMLQNQSVPLDLPGGMVWIVGLDDGYSGRDDLELAESGLEAHDFPRILLSHYPDLADRLKPGQAQLILSGHSHGGQIRLPFLAEMVYRSHARTRYGSGLFMVNGNPLHVSAGLGMSGIPMRLCNWPEIALLTFVAS